MPIRQLLFALAVAAPPAAAEPKPIPPERFAGLHRMIRVQPDEQRFWRIGWHLSIAAARAEAARQGKPILVWAGAGGPPIGVC